MKLQIVSSLILFGGASAFPAVANQLDERAPAKAKKGCSTSKLCDKKLDIPDSMIGYKPGKPTALQKVSAARSNCGFFVGHCTTFNAKAQYVSTSGAHKYIAPKITDIRGPCPGLNAAANHGYLSRDGLPQIGNTILGLGEAYGMTADLSGFLAAYAVAIDGDLLSRTWSIGGPIPSSRLSTLGSAPPQGISYSHNKYEGDSSIGRCDAYTNGGDAHSLSIQRFKYAYEAGMDDDRYTLDKFSREFARNTFRSIKTNPYYFAPLFSTTLVSPAAYNFVVNLMSNRTEQERSGYLDGAMFKTFFGIKGEYPNFEWMPGQERIPENWYRRPWNPAEGYDAVGGVFGDLISEFAAYPTSFRFGGNTKGVDSYTGIDISNFTNGVYTADNLLKPKNLRCFLYQNIQQGLPDLLRGGSNDLTAVTKFLDPFLNGALDPFDCPQVEKFNDNNLNYQGRNYNPKGEAENC